MCKRAPIHGQTKGCRALCVTAQRHSKYLYKMLWMRYQILSLQYERASAVEVATNSKEMSRCTVKLVNRAQDTLKMALYKRSIRFLHASRKNWWSLKINTELYNIFNWIPGYIRHGSILNQPAQYWQGRACIHFHW